MDLTSSAMKVIKKVIAQKIHQENFCISLKICENQETFLLLNFYHLRYIKLFYDHEYMSCLQMHIIIAMYM